MPELPEVETYIRDLRPELRNRQITGAQVFWERTIAEPGVRAFTSQIVGERFIAFRRRGKYMLFELTSGSTLVVHLRMTGKFLFQPTAATPDKHTHVVFDLDDGRSLHYHDTRKFGRIWLLAGSRLEAEILQKLGPEPLAPDFSTERFATKLARRKTSIKAVLLDQGVVAGVGNIYADEALYHAGIHPVRPADSLDTAEIERLHGAIRHVLAQGIKQHGSSLGGSSLQNFKRPGGQQGSYQTEHRVFRRTGQPCARCTTPIERIVLSQRSTHFCPTCQPAGG